VRADGMVKILDFGLAKAMEPATGSSPSLSMSPTITTPAMTQAGMILGTAAYMSPEQARGKNVDKRADIWAFGAVLFEMLAARRPFDGEDVTEVLGAVVRLEPQWDALPSSLPGRVNQVIRACLRKDPKQRAHDIADIRLALEGAFETAAPQAPALVPSGRAVLFTVRYAKSVNLRIDAVMIGTGERRMVVENAYAPVVLSNGHLLFQRDDAILIAPFDATRLAVTGPAIPLIDEVRRDTPLSPYPAAELAVSRTGTLAYVSAAGTASALGLVQPDGTFKRIEMLSNNFTLPRVSPDGHALAFIAARGQVRDVYVYDFRRGGTTRLTQDEYVYSSAWHDNRSLAISSRRQDGAGIFLKSVDGGGERALVPLPPGVTVLRNGSWSRDGTRMAYTVQTGLKHDIWVLTMGEKPTTQLFLTGAPSRYSPAFSPDGRWLAYASDESGRFEVYIRRYPQGDWLPVSTSGGDGPVWRRDGKELFFQGTDAGVPKLMAVSVTPEGASLRLSKPVPLLNLRVPGPTGVFEEYAGSGNFGAGYDILQDGSFVMVRGADPTGTREVVLVQHWFEELKRKVPVK
jgi:hypothetical protein